MVDFESTEQRLDDWGRTVRRASYREGVYSSWAELCVALRGDARGGRPAAMPEQFDGWRVEAA